MQDTATQLAALDEMTTGELADLYRELHGQPCRTRHRAYLIRKNAWRIQANAEGDLSERARKQALELADDADVRVMAPKAMICPPQTGETVTVTRPVSRGPAKPNLDIKPAQFAISSSVNMSRYHCRRCTTHGRLERIEPNGPDL